MPGSTVAVVRLKVTGQPAWACSASAASSSTCASDSGPRVPMGAGSPMAGNSARSRGSKPGSRSMAHSSALQRDDRLDGRVAAPQVGTAQRADAGDVHQSVLSVVERRMRHGWRACATGDRRRRSARRPRSGRRRCPSPRPRPRRPAAPRARSGSALRGQRLPGAAAAVSLPPSASTQPAVAQEHGAAAGGAVRGERRRRCRRARRGSRRRRTAAPGRRRARRRH